MWMATVGVFLSVVLFDWFNWQVSSLKQTTLLYPVSIRGRDLQIEEFLLKSISCTVELNVYSGDDVG